MSYIRCPKENFIKSDATDKEKDSYKTVAQADGKYSYYGQTLSGGTGKGKQYVLGPQIFLPLANEKGEFVKRKNGAVLDKNDTTTVYIGRDDIQHAEKTFLEWLSPTTIVNDSQNGFTALLKDEKGNAQGTVYFSEATTNDKYNNHVALAVVTFSPETAIKHVKKVVFLPHAAWPLDKHKESPFFVGDTDKRTTYDEGVRDWLCIREAKE